ncbi:hypothetical protein HBI77_032660 [Parastagonospora nodorum]|nr:hypothetical protein HBI77_032660 [Parastagonospora nodorum]KAH6021898.1 hypothetical protein HBI83_095290 [Parastagonospora nodorum]
MSSSTKQQNTMTIVVRLPPNSAYADSKISKMGFLTLPPELRNTIYAWLSTTSIAQIHSQNSRGSIGIISRPNNSRWITVNDWRRSARQDLGFLQSCMQIGTSIFQTTWPIPYPDRRRFIRARQVRPERRVRPDSWAH